VDRPVGVQEISPTGVPTPKVEQIALFADRAGRIPNLPRRHEVIGTAWAVALPGQPAAAAAQIDLACAQHYPDRAVSLTRGAEPITKAQVIDVLARVDDRQGAAAETPFAHQKRLAGAVCHIGQSHSAVRGKQTITGLSVGSVHPQLSAGPGDPLVPRVLPG